MIIYIYIYTINDLFKSHEPPNDLSTTIVLIPVFNIGPIKAAINKSGVYINNNDILYTSFSRIFQSTFFILYIDA